MSLGQLVHYEVWRCEWDQSLNPHGPCNKCARLEGLIMERGVGPRPPLHTHCKCKRVFHHSAFKGLYRGGK